VFYENNKNKPNPENFKLRISTIKLSAGLPNLVSLSLLLIFFQLGHFISKFRGKKTKDFPSQSNVNGLGAIVNL
jgi:hypothetical protein